MFTERDGISNRWSLFSTRSPDSCWLDEVFTKPTDQRMKAERMLRENNLHVLLLKQLTATQFLQQWKKIKTSSVPYDAFHCSFLYSVAHAWQTDTTLALCHAIEFGLCVILNQRQPLQRFALPEINLSAWTDSFAHLQTQLNMPPSLCY